MKNMRVRPRPRAERCGPAFSEGAVTRLDPLATLGESEVARRAPLREETTTPLEPRDAAKRTRMVQGAAGLASILGSYVREQGDLNAVTSEVAHGDTATAEILAPLAGTPGAPAGRQNARALDVDGIYDALEDRLRAEFLRSYGNTGG